jgi:hypothetical protein
LTAQIAGRPIGVMLGIGTALNPFSVRPSYRQLDGLSIAEQRRAVPSTHHHALGQVLRDGRPAGLRAER